MAAAQRTRFMGKVDKRTDCRYQVDGECTLRYKIENQVFEIPAWLSDLSARGCRLAIAHPIPIGTVVRIALDLAPDVPIYGQVVHSISSPRSGNYIGVRIIDKMIPFDLFRKLIQDATATVQAPGSPSCFFSLGLTYPSTKAEVHKAFRRLSMKAHPDHGGNEKEFVALYAAYQEAIRLCSE